MGAFVRALKNLDSMPKLAPFIVEKDSMSVRYIHTLKTMKGVYIQWSQIINEFIFAVIHTKVVVKDCISWEPRHLPYPTTEDYPLEQEYESDPEPTYNLKNIAKKEASLTQRTETIWQLDKEKELCRSTRTAKPTQRMEQS